MQTTFNKNHTSTHAQKYSKQREFVLRLRKGERSVLKVMVESHQINVKMLENNVASTPESEADTIFQAMILNRA